MTQETKKLKEKINSQKAPTPSAQPVAGFGLAVAMMMDLVCCLVVGLGIGVLIHKVAHTTPLVIAFFALLGGIAGLVSVVQMGIKRGK